MTGRADPPAAGLTPFHVAVPVHDLEAARRFYREIIGCREGRSAATWVDFNLYGHQFVCHAGAAAPVEPAARNAVDGDEVPVPHCGVVLGMQDWADLRDRLAAAGVEFLVGPRVRFQGEAGEQASLFVADPSGNVLEFKGFRDMGGLFDTD